MESFMTESRFDFITKENKAFIIAFDEEMSKMGYRFGENIGSGYCWGKYMIIYAKPAAKNKKVVARIYIRDDGIVLRMFFSQIDKHREHIEKAPEFIKEAFTGEYGNCGFCEHKKDHCSFRKTYTIDNKVIHKCSGVAFEFRGPTAEKLPAYGSLFREFYPFRG